MINVGVIGYGYWGPNLVRNFMRQRGRRRRHGLRLRQDRLTTRASRSTPRSRTHDIPRRADRRSRASTRSRSPLRSPALRAGDGGAAGRQARLVEKPMASTAEQARQLIEEAEQAQARAAGRSHFRLHAAPCGRCARSIDAASLGELHYYDSVRVNLGLFQHDVNVIWDLAVHDLSIMDYVLGATPVAVSATGMSHVPGQPANIAYPDAVLRRATLIAHINVNWLAPVKIRRTLVGGSKQMIVYDDLEPSEKIKVYDKGITRRPTTPRAGLPAADRLPDRRHVGAEARRSTEALQRRGRTISSHCIDSSETAAHRRRGGPARRPDPRGRDKSMAQRGAAVELDPSKECHDDPVPRPQGAVRVDQDRGRRAVLARPRERASTSSEPKSRRSRSEFARLLQRRARVAVNTGTSALHLALLAAGVGPGDEVITVPFTFVATVAAIGYTGATPVFVDIDPGDRSRWTRPIEAAITPRTRAIMPVHLYGQPADMDPIMADRPPPRTRRDRGRLPGARRRVQGPPRRRHRRLGASVSTPARTSAPTAKAARRDERPDCARRCGCCATGGRRRSTTTSARLSTTGWTRIQGAILRVKLRHLEKWTEARRGLGRTILRNCLGNLRHRDRRARPTGRASCLSHLQRRAPRAAIALQEHLAAAGIETGHPLPGARSTSSADAALGHRARRLPGRGKGRLRAAFWPPLHPEMAPKDVDLVADAIREWLRSR